MPVLISIFVDFCTLYKTSAIVHAVFVRAYLLKVIKKGNCNRSPPPITGVSLIIRFAEHGKCQIDMI
jgi:hypothetical protein